MATIVGTYSADKISITVASHTVVGYQDGSFVNIEPMGDGISSISGADGDVARSISLDPRNQITITLMQTSKSNDVLSSLYDADRISGGDGAFPITVSDLRGSTLVAGTGWITNKASSTFSTSADQTREWTLIVVGEYFSGGTD